MTKNKIKNKRKVKVKRKRVSKQSQRQSQRQNVIVNIAHPAARRKRYSRKTGGGGGNSGMSRQFYSTLVPAGLSDMLKKSDLIDVLDNRILKDRVDVKTKRDVQLPRVENRLKSAVQRLGKKERPKREAARKPVIPEGMLELPTAPGQKMKPLAVSLDLGDSKRRGRPKKEEKEFENRLERLKGELKEIHDTKKPLKRRHSTKEMKKQHHDISEVFKNR